jgi:hypothetical protein
MRTHQFNLAVLAFTTTILMGLASAQESHAQLLAYEGFDYTTGSAIAGSDGGMGFAGGWDETQGSNLSSAVEAGSLQYVDRLGNVLQTSGGKANFSGETGTSTPGRDFSFRRDGAALGADQNNPVFTYISVLGNRQGLLDSFPGEIYDNTYRRGANISLFDGGCVDCASGDFERLNFGGENSNHEFPITAGADFLSIQRGDHPATHPLLAGEQPTFEDFERDFGRSGPTSTRAIDTWQFNAPRIDITVNTSAEPPYVDPDDGEIPSGAEANAVLWQKNPLNGRFGTRFATTPLANQTSFMVARIEHYGASGDGSKYGMEKPDKIVIWMNPNLNAEPNEADADVIIDFAEIEARAQAINDAGGAAMAYRDLNDSNVLSFDRLRLFSGNTSGGRNFAELLIDELRIGETYDSVTPTVGQVAGASAVPEPLTSVLLTMTLAGAICRRPRKRR